MLDILFYIALLSSKILVLFGLDSRAGNSKFERLKIPARSALSPSQTLEGFFKLTWHPSRALYLPRVLLLELQRYKDTIRCVVLGVEVPGHRQQQLTQTLIVCLLKTHFFTSILDFENRIEWS